MLELLQNIFSEISLSEIDSSKEIEYSDLYKNFIKIFPNLAKIFDKGINRDKQEFIRTIKHIFRSIKIYLKILDNNFLYEGFSAETILKIFNKIKKIQEYNKLLIPLILVYHDIGKFIRKRDHPNQSFILIKKENLLSSFNLTENDKQLIEKVIQYHILFATVYTGESTYYGTYSLINDSLLVKLLSDNKYLELFVDLLEIFTYIDILGYSYSQIFDHYVKYYEEINQKLNDIFALLPNQQSAIEKAVEYSQTWFDWRIAGALRIFQFIGTKPYLTKEFYYNLIKNSIESVPFENFGIISMEWDELKKTILRPSYKIQVKYALAFLIILAFGSFHRASVKEDAKISDKLLLFWILLCKEVNKRSIEDKKALWNVFILGIHNWFALSQEDFLKIDKYIISNIIQEGKSYYNKDLKEYTLNLDLSLIFSS